MASSSQSLPPHHGEHSSSPSNIKKQESASPSDPAKLDEKPAKPHKPLNRVPRACNACRKQKMRCEGADNPPCKRCRHANIECLFEKPNREATLTSEAGMERMRAVEDRVRILDDKISHLQHGVSTIQHQLGDLMSTLRGTTPAIPPPRHASPLYGRPEPSPSVHSNHSAAPGPSMSSDRDMAAAQTLAMTRNGRPHHSPTEIRRPSISHGNGSPYQQRLPGPRDISQPPEPYPAASQYQGQQLPSFGAGALPPISYMGPPPPLSRPIPPMRDHPLQAAELSSHIQNKMLEQPLRSRRIRQVASNVTSAESSDDEGLLLAPLRTIQDMDQLNDHARTSGNRSTATSEARTRSQSPQMPDRHERPLKRRKIHHDSKADGSKEIVTAEEGRELFRIYYEGCSTFLSVFDPRIDTYDTLREKSLFAVNCICMVAVRSRDAGGSPSPLYKSLIEEVQRVCSQTLFAKVTSLEPVRAVLILSGWSSNGWLSAGHAVRMAIEYGMNHAWPKLRARMRSKQPPPAEDDRTLVVCVRIWFCLYLFEHQLSYGTGRPAILKEDESIIGCREFLNHPLTTADDMRLVSTVELLVIREHITNKLSPLSGPILEHHWEVVPEARARFQRWYEEWDAEFSHKFPDVNVNFYRQSLQIQHYFAELFHNSTLLRGLQGPEEVRRMDERQRDVGHRAIEVALQGIHVCLHMPAYQEGLKYAVTYTHLTAVSAACMLVRLMRLFPEKVEQLCGVNQIVNDVQQLAHLMSSVPATRYAKSLRATLSSAIKKRDIPPRPSNLNPIHPSNQYPPPQGYTDPQHPRTANYGPVPPHPHPHPPHPQYDHISPPPVIDRSRSLSSSGSNHTVAPGHDPQKMQDIQMNPHPHPSHPHPHHPHVPQGHPQPDPSTNYMISNSPNTINTAAYNMPGAMPDMFPTDGMMPGGYAQEFPILAHEGMGNLTQFPQGGLESFMLPQTYDGTVSW